MVVKRGLDLGGSDIRLGLSKDHIVVLPSTCLEIDINAPVKEYLADDCKYDDFIIENHPKSTLCRRRFVRSDVMDHYNGETLYCDNQSEKCEQEITYINAAYALAYACASKGENDVVVNVGICIPTSEYYADTDYVSELKRGLAGSFTICFPLAGERIEFQIPEEGIRVTPEGVVAALSFSQESTFREGLTVIVDAGHRSTDITILKNFKPIGRSAVSRPIGGINIEAYVRGEMEREGILLNTEQVHKILTNRYIIKNGELIDVTEMIASAGRDPEKVKLALFHYYTDVTEADINNAMNEYFIKLGSDIKNVTGFVTEAKRVFASSIRRDINDVLAREMLNISAINNLVPIGRPFSGDLENDTNLVRILTRELGCKAKVYPPSNLATANVSAIMAVMDN